MGHIPSWYFCTDDEVEALAEAGVPEPGFPHDSDSADPRLTQKPTIFLAPGADSLTHPLEPAEPEHNSGGGGGDPAPPHSPPPLPERGWTDARQRRFLTAIAEGCTVESACRAAGLSVASAYKFRRSARGAAFALGWNAAALLQRDRIADALVSRVLDGQEVVVRRPDGTETVRHFYDNRLAQATLTRLDRLASEQADAGADHAARMVAQDFEAYLDLLESEAPSARAALFVARRAVPRLLEAEQPVPAPSRLTPSVPAGSVLEPVAALARADLYARMGVAHPAEIAIADLDFAQRDSWTAEQWQRAHAAGLLTPAAPGSQAPEDTAYEDADAPQGNPQLPQPAAPRRPTTGIMGRVWRDPADDSLMTNFPPPPDFIGYEHHRWGHPDYERELDDDEHDAVEDALDERDQAVSADDAALRDEWFRRLEEEDWTVLEPFAAPLDGASGADDGSLDDALVASAQAIAASLAKEPPRNAPDVLFVESSQQAERQAMARDPDFVEENSEQADDGQAQDVADEAIALRRGLFNGSGHDPTVETGHGGRANPAGILPDDVPDLIDTMNQMVSSGRIDNGAFAGEPMMDDEEDQLGVTDRDVEDDDLGITYPLQERFGDR